MSDPPPTVDEVFAILEEKSAQGDFLDRSIARWRVAQPAAAASPAVAKAEADVPEERARPVASVPPEERASTTADEAQAALDFAVLRKRKGGERLKAVRRSPKRMRSLALVESILAQARKELGMEPKAALEWVDCADAVALRIPFAEPGGYPRLRLRLQAQRANVLRVLGDLPGADALWVAIREFLAATQVDDPAAEAERCSLEASLRRAQRRFGEAEELLDRAECLYRQVGDRVGRLKILIQRGTTAEYAGDIDRALAWKRQAVALAEPETDPKLFWATRQNLANALLQLGRPREAADQLAAALPSFDRCADLDLNLRLTWFEGRAAAYEGRFSDAARKLRSAAQDCLDRGLIYDFAQVSLDLAGLFVAQGRPAAARKLSAAIEPVFRSRGVHARARQALRLFQQAAHAERLDEALLATLRRYLDTARDDPGLPFETPVLWSPAVG